MRIEREYCSDELATEACGNATRYAATESGARQAFRWTETGGMQDLTLGMTGDAPRSSWAYDVSADGSVVVGFMDDNVAILWNEDDGMRRLDEWLIDKLGLGDALDGWKLTQATGISDDGLTIVGDGINPRGNDEGWVVKLDPVSLLGDLNRSGRARSSWIFGLGGAYIVQTPET